MAENPSLEPQRAMRLVFEYTGDQVRLVSQQPVTMVIAGIETGPADHPGYYVDARDAAERTLARVAAPYAFARSMEVFPEQPDEPISRIDVPHPTGAFTVIMAAPEDTEHVTILRLEPSAGAPSEETGSVPAPMQSVDLARFPLQFER